MIYAGDGMRLKTLLLIPWFAIVVMACNLSNPNSAPPTVEPRGFDPDNAPTAQATLGLQDPGQSANANSSTPGAPGGATVQNVLFDLTSDVQPDRLFRHVEALVNFRTRHINSSKTAPNEGIGAAYKYINSELLAIERLYSDQRFIVLPNGQEFVAYSGDGVESVQQNAVAVLNGTEVGAGTIVIGAHYDSRTDDLLNATADAPGAADNGSGVAVVLELARVLSQHPQRSTIIFVLFSAEEHNRQGSRVFVEEYILGQNIDVVAMINVDTVGSWNNSQGEINDEDIRLFANPENQQSLQLARTINFVGVNYDLSLNIDFNPQLDREGRFGDHFSFDEQGIAAVRFIEAYEDNYNREGRDTLDKIEVAYMVDCTETILGLVSALTSGPRPPRNINMRDAGGGLQSLHWESTPGAVSYLVAVRRPGSLIYDNYFPADVTYTNGWDRWGEFVGVAIAAVDANGQIGPLSVEFPLR